MRYAQLVMGPAGSGKSTYCSIMQQHAIDSKKTIDVVNLDPAAEYFDYKPLADIRELIQLDDVMDSELNFGPNGGLVFCMEYLVENATWLTEELGDTDEDYIIFDCPGQIELYTHMTVMRQLITMLQNLNFHICGVFLIDVQFMVDAPKFLSGTLAALSAMINLEIPHINVLSKMDLLSKNMQKKLDDYIEPDPYSLLTDAEKDPWNNKYRSLTESIGRIITDYSLVRFLPLNIKDEESIADIKLIIDNTIQYGEDTDIKVRDFDEPDNEIDEST
ncbi:GPN-loop GTPase 3 [Camponotus floridanus]|uniref:GPN-loop GTPase 3 n=1 Tax=Camponotus floridanus TaxID=104421 RepID=E2AX64_CAMFO|nr:GPN-loop GTPase 3 [Camponotus floridanus]XP_025264853.1 GPN-loop GTPase 3 [Camponotus floridanus]EFN61947.1 GPN-loop GTPase 3 [Camponotus floridanus]